MEYCHYIWTGAFSLYLELLDELKNGYAGLLVLDLLCGRYVASLSPFYSYCFCKCSSELAQLVSISFSQGRCTHYSERLHDFCVTIPRCYKDVYVNSFFPCTARLWNSLPIKCFPLTYNLNGFKSRISRHLLTVAYF